MAREEREFSVEAGWQGPKRLTDGYCAHCKRYVAFSEPPSGPTSWSIHLEHSADGEEPEWSEEHVFVVGVCPRRTCAGATIVHEVWEYYGPSSHLQRQEIVFPFGSERPFLPEEVPKELRELYDEAGRIEFSSPNGAAFLGRRMLEQTLRAELKKKGHLHTLIDGFLAKASLPPSLHRLMHDVREFGNIAAHPSETDQGVWVEVDQEEATYVLDVVAELLDFVYVRPTRQEAMRDRWEAKKRGEIPAGVPGPKVKVEPAPSPPAGESPISDPDDDLPF